MELLLAIRLWITGVSIALDRLLNTLFGGSYHESVSLRAAKAWKAGKIPGCVLCRILDFFHADHCRIVAWWHGIEDMPTEEHMHISDIPSEIVLVIVLLTLAAPLGWFLADVILRVL